MSNFVCPHCGMTNIDCGKNGYKTAREIQLEQENHLLRLSLKDKDIVKIVEENDGLKSEKDFLLQKTEVLQEENEKYSSELGDLRKKLEKVKDIIIPIKHNTCFGMYCGAIDEILAIIESEE